MKTNTIIILALAFIMGVSLNSCVEDGDYTVPNDLGEEENLALNSLTESIKSEKKGTFSMLTVSQLKSLFVEGQVIEITDSLAVKGYVTSSDRTGNFFKEIFIQDKAEDPEAAVQIVLNLNDTYNKYNVGREVYINLIGLFIGETRSGNGVVTIGGVANGSTVDDLSIKQINEQVLRSATTEVIVPKGISIPDISNGNIGMSVKIENAQFARSIQNETFTDPDEPFDTTRALESCTDSGSSIGLETSSFANFKFAPLPTGSFTINAVVSKTFDGSSLVLALNDNEDITTTGERCDPDFLECTGTTSTNNILFEEDFESITNESQLDGMGWTNINVLGGSERFERSSFSGDSYLKISAFGTDEAPLNAWLVTPSINLDSSTNEELSFQISSNFETGTVIEVYVTENYTGDPTTTEWKLLDIEIPIGDSGFGSFEELKANISCLNGDVNIGFKYFGSDGAAETRYHIDDIKVTGN